MNKKILLLGNTGKMGIALNTVFLEGYNVIGKNSSDLDAGDFCQVTATIKELRPDIVINTIAFLGIDPCEVAPNDALQLNSIFPKHLAELSLDYDFTLVHFSTDAVFNDTKKDFYNENDSPMPLNLYGITKYAGDCLITNICKRYYIFRIPVLFGESIKKNQFVEKMLSKIDNGEPTLRVSDDIVSSPSYSLDIASHAHDLIASNAPYGLYHLANEGAVSLYELMSEIINNLDLKVKIVRGSYMDFPFIGRKNTFTPINSIKTNKLRPWQEAVHEYCKQLNK